MKRTSLTTMAALLLLLCGLLPTALGCDRDVAGEVVTLSGAYLGDVITVLATGYLHDALGIEAGGSADGHTHDDEHSHEAEPLHDHEH